MMDLTFPNIWIEFSSTLQLVLKGLIVGIIISAPMGPVGILCIQRTMKKGRIFGIVTGAGAALSDFIYALMTGLGMSFVIDFIERGQTLFWLKLMGSIMLLIFGIHTYLQDPRKGMRTKMKRKGTLFYNFISHTSIPFRTFSIHLHRRFNLRINIIINTYFFLFVIFAMQTPCILFYSSTP